MEILESYGDRITYVSRRDHGQSDAINQGLRKARGDILAYLNSDDVYFPGALRRVTRHFQKNPASLCAYGQAWHLQEDGAIMARYYSDPWSYPHLLDVCFLCQPAVFWRREVVERFGFFDSSLHWAMDYDYWLRVGRSIPFDYLDDAYLAGSRLHGGTKTLSQRIKVHEEILQVVLRHSPRPPLRWLLNLSHMILEDKKLPEYRGKITSKTRNALMVETVLEKADQYSIPVGADLLGKFEKWL